MSTIPQPRWVNLNGERWLTIDWRQWFRNGLKFWHPSLGGEMRGFHIVFHLRINTSGTLYFVDDDGSIIRRNGEVVHEDRTSHPPVQSEIRVQAGDDLEIAQWQFNGEWTWGARLVADQDSAESSLKYLTPYLQVIQERLKQPNGPPLKMYTAGSTPLRTVVSLYSMIRNGYVPARVLIFGDYQWSSPSRQLFSAFLPFAEIISKEEVLERISAFEQNRLCELAGQHWFVMKTCIGLFYPPHEFCLMDDDVFILGSTTDALYAFQQHNLVFAPDTDYSNSYAATWPSLNSLPLPLRTGTINTGLYWLRNTLDPHMLAVELLRVPLNRVPGWQWEQGFMASQFVHESVHPLSSQRYFYPYFDGLPGGMLGYDYDQNPCGFASIHFGGLAEKPSDQVTLVLAPAILRRH
jgi:hypothetical protein